MKKYVLLMMFLSLVGVTLFAQSKPVVVVASFNAKGVDKDEAEVVTELFTSEYANTGMVDVVDRNNFDKISDQLKFQSSDWSNADKVAQLGKALNANHVVVGQLLREKVAVTIKVIDVNTTTILASHTGELDDMEDLLDELPKICKELSEKTGGILGKKHEKEESSEIDLSMIEKLRYLQGTAKLENRCLSDKEIADALRRADEKHK